MTPPAASNWIVLFLDTDNNRRTAWEGYDYVVNAQVKNATLTTLKKRVNGAWQEKAEIPYALQGNQGFFFIEHRKKRQ